MQTPKEAYTFDYPQAIAFAETQESIFWTATEFNVEKDIQDIRVNMSEAEAQGVLTTLKLFTLYELVAGRDYWLGRVMRRFPQVIPEHQLPSYIQPTLPLNALSGLTSTSTTSAMSSLFVSP